MCAGPAGDSSRSQHTGLKQPKVTLDGASAASRQGDEPAGDSRCSLGVINPFSFRGGQAMPCCMIDKNQGQPPWHNYSEKY